MQMPCDVGYGRRQEPAPHNGLSGPPWGMEDVIVANGALSAPPEVLGPEIR